MPQRDLKNNIQVVHLGALTLSGTTPAASSWVDTRGFDTCTFLIVTGTVTVAGTAGIDFTVQESDATGASGATAVADAELIGTEAVLSVTDNAEDNIIAGTIGYVGDARYARINGVGTTNTNAVVSVIAVLSHGQLAPELSGVGTAVAAT